MSEATTMRAALEALPPDATITLKVGQLLALVEGRDPDIFDPVGTAEASEITGIDDRTLRRQWTVWDRIQREGGRPQVRVTRKGEGPRSDLLFDRGDCFHLARREAASDQPPSSPPTAPEDPNDAEAIVDRLLSGG